MQGFSNGLIFVIFDRRIRVRFIRCIYRLSCSPMKKLYDSLKDPDTKCNCVRFIKCIRGCIFHCICPIRFNIKSCFRFICCIVSCILCCCLRKRRGTNHHDNNVSISSDDDNEILDDSYRSLYSGMQASVIHADRQKTFNESEKEVSLVFMDLSQSYGSISDEQELCK